MFLIVLCDYSEKVDKRIFNMITKSKNIFTDDYFLTDEKNK